MELIITLIFMDTLPPQLFRSFQIQADKIFEYKGNLGSIIQTLFTDLEASWSVFHKTNVKTGLYFDDLCLSIYLSLLHHYK